MTGTGARVVADMLAGYGVTHVFGVPAILRRTLAALEAHHPHVQRVVTHGEKSAAYMADGYARVSGRPGIAMAQVVGALNLAAGLREPFLAGSPVIALTGGRSPATRFRHVYQEVDDVPAFEPVTKFNATIDDVSRFPDLLRHAFRVATTGAPGPVHLQIQGNEGQLDAEPTDVEPLVEPECARVPARRLVPADEDLLAVLRLLAAARRPVVVAGGGVRASRAGAELVALAERLGVPVATSANGKDTIPGTHPLSVGVVGTYSRECANQVVARADLVCFVGTRTGGMTTHVWTVPPIGVPAIQIDVEPSHLGRNYPLRAAVAADAKLALARMLALAGADTAGAERGAWLAEVDRRRADWRARYREVLTSDAVPVRPERIAAELTAGLPRDAVLVVDTGHAGMWMAQFHDVTSPDQGYLRSAGHLGWAFSAGLGAKCAAGDRPVVAFTGDAGLHYHLGEIETAARRGINLVTVVNNNSGGNQSKRGFDRAYDGRPTARSRELWTYRDVDFARVGTELGALGLRVDRPGDLPKALDQALHAGRPVIVDVRTDLEVVAPPPFAPQPLAPQPLAP
ncbi:thiamine pyrophosphate-binding protein [Cryptosporangium arvum]|uniref:Thiamine pyrophosphate-dependent enzyme, putative carboligase or decarboxylase n=1 Tax=Cryptosporangium arvum DSM 44712 TaxID=927661 RepID=A0A010Z2J3_9ACTN|nr:thiamine pyrophosphate-binding protein [Cryptosporangium arvum]EXG81643.1 thiamine pyrophosphate-dependent enzyme, putative carboligase or decarboxylase [Cryptosporangium arvum DSM 44712]